MVQCFNNYEQLKNEIENSIYKFSRVLSRHNYTFTALANFYHVKKQLHFCPQAYKIYGNDGEFPAQDQFDKLEATVLQIQAQLKQGAPNCLRQLQDQLYIKDAHLNQVMEIDNETEKEATECVICKETLSPAEIERAFINERINNHENWSRLRKNLNTQMKKLRTITLTCSHSQFHNKCIKEWIRISPDCPLCKKAIDLNEIE